MQYLHILEGKRNLSGRFSQFSNFADTAVFPFTVAMRHKVRRMAGLHLLTSKYLQELSGDQRESSWEHDSAT